MGGTDDLVEIASMMAESLADLVLLAPEAERANLLAHAISVVGHMILEKSGAFEGGSRASCLKVESGGVHRKGHW